jgi:pimeloyl-ACP methyl ester carboxylesterase
MVAGRLARILLALTLLIAVSISAAFWFGIPYLERRWTYRVVKPEPGAPWALPANTQTVTFRTGDGVTLRGWLFEAAAPRNGVTVLVLHGNYGDLPAYVAHIQVLQKHGFDVLLFNFRGFGISDGRTESEATLVLDAEAAMRYLVVTRGLAPRSIAIVGISLGAPIAATLAARSPCRAVALISTVASARHQIQKEMPWVPEIVLGNLGSPFDAAASIGRARCPVALVHGADDDVVRLDQAKQVYDAARQPKRFIVVPVAGHGLLNARPDEYLPALGSFFLDAK